MIVPCGLVNKSVTSLERELGKSVPMDDVVTAASRNFGRVFRSQMLWLESLDDLLGDASLIERQEVVANEDTRRALPKSCATSMATAASWRSRNLGANAPIPT